MIKSNVKRFLWLLVFVLSANMVVAQKYRNNMLTYKVIVNGDNGDVVSYVKPVGRIAALPDKRYYWFLSEQIKSTVGGYNGKLLNGSYQEFYTNKNLKESGYIYKGLKSGIWKSWDEKGRLKNDYTWNFGQRNGNYHRYDSLGKIIEHGRYRYDLLSGKQYSAVADSTKVVYYKKGQIAQPKSIVPGFIRRIFK